MKNFDERESLRLKYIFTLLLSLIMWLFPGSALTFILEKTSLFSSTKEGRFILAFVPHTLMFLSLLYASKRLLNIKILDLMGRKRNWKRFLTISLLTLIVLSLFSLFNKDAIVYNNDDSIGIKFLFLLLSLVLFLPQTLTEEIVFRVLPAVIYSPVERKLNKKEALFVSLLSALFFTLPHISNTEVLTSDNPLITLSVYFLWGLLSSLLAFYSSSYIPSWAMHYANNLFSVVVVSEEKTTLNGAPLFYDTKDTSFFLPLLIVALFLVIFTFEDLMRRREDEN